MTIRFLSVACTELTEAVDRYNRECPGLGYEFADAVQQTLQRILTNPVAWHCLSARARRCITHRFPYGIIYQIRMNEILIVSVMHLHRHPLSWKRNLPDK